ncbi:MULTISPECIES: hypothetical protein [Paenibacillus]|uniref:Uncharacterized protein n=1 Tax=Paenibacillus odorifer TaxID=189426 RepID=A0ABX3HVC3_9BACL|nr:hypothetical protein [Paenibacillus odorifer]OMD55304.1 hypothetical protein BSK51_04420 [Paenibacillus odorifer]
MAKKERTAVELKDYFDEEQFKMLVGQYYFSQQNTELQNEFIQNPKDFLSDATDMTLIDEFEEAAFLTKFNTLSDQEVQTLIPLLKEDCNTDEFDTEGDSDDSDDEDDGTNLIGSSMFPNVENQDELEDALEDLLERGLK